MKTFETKKAVKKLKRTLRKRNLNLRSMTPQHKNDTLIKWGHEWGNEWLGELPF